MKYRKPDIGEEFEGWVVLEPGSSYSACECVCGLQLRIQNSHLHTGRTRKCKSCPSRCSAFPLKVRNAVHHAIHRCGNPTYPRFNDYGGRGIVVHGPWITDRLAFMAYVYALSGSGDETLVLDRIDNDGNYEPGNLRWATTTESRINQRPKSYTT